MQRFIKLSAVMAAIVAAPAFAAIAVDGNAEFDTGVASGNNSDKSSFQGGRIELNFNGRAEGNGGFVAGRGTVIASNAGNSSGVDDAWVQIGTSAVDVKLGRFEAADLYPTPGDVFRIGGAGLSTTNVLRGRTTYAGTAGTNDRVHMALTAALGAASLEVGLVDTKDVSNTAPGKGGSKGIRPSVAFAAGPVNARIGFESGKTADGAAGQASFTGVGGGLSAGLGMATLRFNFGSNKTKLSTGETKTTGILLGADVGALNVSFESGKKTTVGGADVKTTGVFAAYAIPLFGIKGATFQPALGTGSDKSAGVTKTTTKVGARVHYDF